MRSRAAFHLLAVLALGALALVMIVPATFVTSANAAEDTCTAASETPDIVLLRNNQPVSADNPVNPWQNLRLQFSLDLEDGHCAGQTYTINVPDELRSDSGSTWELNTDEGETAATMTYVDGMLVVTLTEYVETHQDVALTGWIDAWLTNEITPGENHRLTFNTNGQTTTIEVPTGQCVGDCDSLPTGINKWGSADAADAAGNRTGTVTVEVPLVTQEMAGDAGSVAVEWTDTLTSGDQSFTCSASGSTYTGRDVWGDPVGGTTASVTVTSCTDETISGTIVVPVGQYARVHIPMTFTGDGPWTDNASVTIAGITQEKQASVVHRNGGGSASGIVPVTPTPSESPTPTESATPSESPSATPSESPSTTPSASATTPAASATGTTSAPATTPAATTPVSPSLARTGANSLVLVLGAGSLLIVGAVALHRARARE